MESPKTQMEEKIGFNKIISEDVNDGRKIIPYTWIYRWENPNEFKLEKTTITSHRQKQYYIWTQRDTRDTEIYTIL